MLASIAGEKDAIISAFDTGNGHLEVIDCYWIGLEYAQPLLPCGKPLSSIFCMNCIFSKNQSFHHVTTCLSAHQCAQDENPAGFPLDTLLKIPIFYPRKE